MLEGMFRDVMNWKSILPITLGGLAIGALLIAAGVGKSEANSLSQTEKKVKVEIWSDVVCPYCYIGKRRFEKALSQFEHRDSIEIVWRSFQLDPSMPKLTGKTIYEHLGEKYGGSPQSIQKMVQNVVNMGKMDGLEYNFDKSIQTNTFDAHRLIQMAKSKGLADEAEERLFRAYFTEGKHIGDYPTLIALGKEIGLDAKEVKTMLEGNAFSEQVNSDITESRELGIEGVPFFLIEGEQGISGAQSSETFLKALEGIWAEEEAK